MVLALLTVLSVAQEAAADECEGVRMAGTSRVDGQPLVLNGMGVREVSFMRLNVCVAGLYLAQRSRSASEILASETPKRVVLHFLRSADRSRMRGGLGDHFSREGLSDEFSEFVRLLPDEMMNGTRAAVTHRPGAGVEVAVNGRRGGTVASEAFARAFFEMLLGPGADSEADRT